MSTINFDNASASPVDPRVVEAMMPYFRDEYGNPSSFHSIGRRAKEAMEDARSKVAELIGAERSDEIIFTSGGTESNNLALIGTAYRNKRKGTHIIISAVEHISVLNAAKFLQRNGFKLTVLPVDKYGLVDLEALKSILTDDTILVSIMLANGEVGTIEPVREACEIVKEKGAYFHTDAIAACGQIPVRVEELEVDLISLSSSDMYGPKGVGALYVKKGTPISPITYGGGQERGLRSGTENVPGIVGMGEAARIVKAEMKKEAERLTAMRDRLIEGVLKRIDYSYLNGHPTRRLPNNANIRFSFIEGESIILSLEMEGILASTGSACTSKTLMPSHVLTAMGIKHEEAHGSIQFTMGRYNKESDVDKLLNILPGIVSKLREMSPLTPKKEE